MPLSVFCSTSRLVGLTTFVLVGALLLPPSAFSSSADDLVALAKREKARRAAIAKKAKVLTQEDAKDASGSVTALLESSKTPPSKVAVPEASLEVQEASWKRRAEAARAVLESSEKRLGQLEQELRAYRSDLTPLSAAEAQDPLRLQKREAGIVEMTKTVKAQQDSVAGARKALSNLEDEARRSGVPAGWLR
mgnify:CR=1 FL=1